MTCFWALGGRVVGRPSRVVPAAPARTGPSARPGRGSPRTVAVPGGRPARLPGPATLFHRATSSGARPPRTARPRRRRLPRRGACASAPVTARAPPGCARQGCRSADRSVPARARSRPAPTGRCHAPTRAPADRPSRPAAAAFRRPDGSRCTRPMPPRRPPTRNRGRAKRTATPAGALNLHPATGSALSATRPAPTDHPRPGASRPAAFRPRCRRLGRTRGCAGAPTHLQRPDFARNHPIPTPALGTPPTAGGRPDRRSFPHSTGPDARSRPPLRATPRPLPNGRGSSYLSYIHDFLTTTGD